MLKVCRFVLAALLVWQGGAFAQTTTAAKPTPSTSTATSTTATKKPANTGEIYRWVDKNGKVQYGTDVPEDRRSTAKRVDTRGNIVSSRIPANIGGPPNPSTPSGQDGEPAKRQPVTAREKCEAAWKQYNEAQACFAQYRQGTVGGAGNRGGSNYSPEAFQKCPNLVEPAPCQ